LQNCKKKSAGTQSTLPVGFFLFKDFVKEKGWTLDEQKKKEPRNLNLNKLMIRSHALRKSIHECAFLDSPEHELLCKVPTQLSSEPSTRTGADAYLAICSITGAVRLHGSFIVGKHDFVIIMSKLWQPSGEETGWTNFCCQSGQL
jgi:hypothetical protein